MYAITFQLASTHRYPRHVQGTVYNIGVRPSYGKGPRLLPRTRSRAARGKTTTRGTLTYRNYCESVMVHTVHKCSRGLETHALQRARYCTGRHPSVYGGRWFLDSCSFGANSQTEKQGSAPKKSHQDNLTTTGCPDCHQQCVVLNPSRCSASETTVHPFRRSFIKKRTAEDERARQQR
jgi:hypothetical protein